MNDIEKLGYFYLGRRYDPDSGQILAEPVMYDSRDLTTHAVCIGMTGSGKTGLCISLLEEAAIDGVPAIAIDPKGDLGNLLLTFPALDAESFRPWIDELEAGRSGVEPDEQARRIAETWRKGLEQWGQDGARIERLRAAVDTSIYTPGSRIGRPLSLLGWLATPAPDVVSDPDALAERVETATGSLLSLLGVQADPLRSREHVLLSTILQDAWKAGRGFKLEGLIEALQRPPFERVGALSLESFFPAKERFELAVALNSLAASPSFALWGEGDPLDVGRLLYTEEGKPRLTVISIAHLDDRARMFVVALLLNEVVAWVRRQPGSQSLRAILYMDEVFGFLPPTANPPSKKPLLTLLKQARAHGVGVVLATQNPVDLDYKALSNAGTWFLGRLQTERDKARVLDGLDSLAAHGLDRARLDTLLSSLAKRVFVMHDVHEDGPILLHSRWALSYLAGPLSREQITRLSATVPRPEHGPPATRQPPSPAVSTNDRAEPVAASRPVLEPGIEEVFLHPAEANEVAETPCLYEPGLFARARLHYVLSRADLDAWREIVAIGRVDGGDAAWERIEDASTITLEVSPRPDARYRDVPRAAASAKSYKTWARGLAARLHRDHKLEVWHCERARAWSRPGETKASFVARIDVQRREARDGAIDTVRNRYAAKIAMITERVRRAEQRIEREHEQYESARSQAAISLGATVLGALFGRKLGSAGTIGRATTTMRGAGRAAQQKADVARAREDADALRAQIETLEHEVEAELARIASKYADDGNALKTVAITPRKSDIRIERIALAWIPGA